MSESTVPPQPSQPRRGKVVNWVMIVVCAAILWHLTYGFPRARRVEPPTLTQQITSMRQIGFKLRQYEADHPGAEAEKLAGKSVDDLVAMEILYPSDAAFLRDHKIRFYGYDPKRVAHDVPLMEGVHTLGSLSQRIVCHSDLSVGVQKIESGK